MTLPPVRLALKPLTPKEGPSLGLVTQVAADSLEGVRLVRASRGSGWWVTGGVATPWVTQGIMQENGCLVVWGQASVPAGQSPEVWPLTGEEGRAFVRAFVQAWTVVPQLVDPFTPHAVVPYRHDGQWSFAFLPPELRSVLDSLQPLPERLVWDHVRHPDAAGAPAWAFASAALAWLVVEGSFPWAQDDEASLRQELRDLKKTLTDAELPAGPDPETLRLWSDSLVGRASTARWQAWAAEARVWTAAADAVRDAARTAARQRRHRRRQGQSFWRRRGTVVALASGLGALFLVIVGSVVWSIVKPDPTDAWTPRQVVEGYYQAYDALDSDRLHKLAAPGAEKDVLERDQNETTNLFVLRQVRTAYERSSPVLRAEEWEAAGQPALEPGRLLWGVTQLRVEGADSLWTARYHRWTTRLEEDLPAAPVGSAVVDHLTLVETPRGWKIHDVQRSQQPLP